MSRRYGAVVIAAFLLPGVALAHDQWADGSAVPAWIKSSCCGPADAHQLRPDQVHQSDCNGNLCWRIDGYPYPIPFSSTLPSQDGQYWAFFKRLDDEHGSAGWSQVYCFFAPMEM
jgi:hypothetical protein